MPSPLQGSKQEAAGQRGVPVRSPGIDSPWSVRNIHVAWCDHPRRVLCRHIAYV